MNMIKNLVFIDGKIDRASISHEDEKALLWIITIFYLASSSLFPTSIDSSKQYVPGSAGHRFFVGQIVNSYYKYVTGHFVYERGVTGDGYKHTKDEIKEANMQINSHKSQDVNNKIGENLDKIKNLAIRRNLDVNESGVVQDECQLHGYFGFVFNLNTQKDHNSTAFKPRYFPKFNESLIFTKHDSSHSPNKPEETVEKKKGFVQTYVSEIKQKPSTEINFLKAIRGNNPHSAAASSSGSTQGSVNAYRKHSNDLMTEKIEIARKSALEEESQKTEKIMKMLNAIREQVEKEKIYLEEKKRYEEEKKQKAEEQKRYNELLTKQRKLNEQLQQEYDALMKELNSLKKGH